MLVVSFLFGVVPMNDQISFWCSFYSREGEIALQTCGAELSG